MDWNDLQHLLALAQHHTLPAAAEHLGVNRTTVSRRIEQLEKDLGAKLVERIGRDLVLTEAGREAVATAQQIDGELHGLERQVFGRDRNLAGIIRLTCPPGIACLLASCFKSFQDAHPEVTLHLSAGYVTEDLEMMEADVALRLTTQPPENLAGKIVARPRTAMYTSRALAERLDSMTSIDYIRSAILDHGDKTFKHLELNRSISTNNIDLAKALIKAGKGAGSLPCYLAEDDEDLVRISDSQLDQLPELWLLYHPRLRSQLRIRTFIDHLEETFSTIRPVIEAS